MAGKPHWERVHGAKAPDEVSWYRPHLERSLAFLEEGALGLDAGIIDAGASILVDDLLARGYRDVTVLDITERAIDLARKRLGSHADAVTWLAGDITSHELPPARYGFWHDRAVCHFLTSAEERRRYVAAVRRALRVNGYIVVATFSPAGPEKCSGLEVARYGAEELYGQFGGSFRKVASCSKIHTAPWRTEQEFVSCYCRMEP